MSSNMTDPGWAATLSLSAAPASDTSSPAPPAPMNVTDEPFLQLPQRQTAACVRADAPGAQQAQVHDFPWNADGVGEHSPQPHPTGWACMRTEQLPQRHPTSWDRLDTEDDEHEGQPHEHLPGVHEQHERPVPFEARELLLLALLTRLVLLGRAEREVEDAPPLIARPAEGMTNASASLPAKARVAAPIKTEVVFMARRWCKALGPLRAACTSVREGGSCLLPGPALES